MRFKTTVFAILLVFCGPVRATPASTEPAAALDAKQLYLGLKSFGLDGRSSVATNLVLQRDRVQMTFNGTFYFEAPIAGKTYGAVFIGSGHFHADPPPLEYERENLQRLLKADSVDTNFQTAVLRFSDDTYQLIAGHSTAASAAPSDARNLAGDFEPRLLKQTGMNVSARLAISILNGEQPGFFIAQFDKGKLGRFTFLMDYQERIPATVFGINGGEKGLIFAHNPDYFNDVWMAFYSLEDWKAKRVEYSDTNDLVSVKHYKLNLDLTEATKKQLKLVATMNLVSKVGGLRAIPFAINESLSEDTSERLKKAMLLTAVTFVGGKPIYAVQEPWESGITLFLPQPLAAGESLTVIAGFQGKFLVQPDKEAECFYPRSTIDWYPRHGYLNRSTYDLVFEYGKHLNVVTLGKDLGEKPDPDSRSDLVSEWRVDSPVAFLTFAVGNFRDHTGLAKGNGIDIPLNLYSPRSPTRMKADFVLAEMNNSLRYFSALFGPYQYHEFSAVYFPEGYGQGFATLLLLPTADTGYMQDFLFIAHETSHQWWGDEVAWRSYRDQWLSEGFANYSGLLYVGFRMNFDAEQELIRGFRRDLDSPAYGETGISKKTVAELGPLILGQRLSTRATLNGYQVLIYEKGSLVLRMLHYLFTDPQTGSGKPFFDMMTDFVNRYRNRSATTDEFIQVANDHFASTPLARRFGLKNLNWFFKEWVYSAYLPSYRLEYSVDKQADGSYILNGTLYQDDVPKDFVMPIPLVLHFGKDKVADLALVADGPQQTVKVRLPSDPTKVELDPQMWVLSRKTSVKHLK